MGFRSGRLQPHFALSYSPGSLKLVSTLPGLGFLICKTGLEAEGHEVQPVTY